MRRDVKDLQAFYATPLGAAAAEMVMRKLVEAWGDGRGLDVLGIGYPTPFLEPFRPAARRVVAAMPLGQGVERWPPDRPAACLADEHTLPFTNALFDRIAMVHALEESDDPAAMLDDARRVMAPSGRLIVIAASRAGLWSRVEATPFGHGRPFSRPQLEAAVRAAGLEPTAWSRALYMPPLAVAAPYAELMEQIGSRIVPAFSGLVMLEAVKQTFAPIPKGATAAVFVPRGLQPVPVGAASARDAQSLDARRESALGEAARPSFIREPA